MSTEMKREIEVTGATVDEAVATGIQQLGVTRSDIIIDVIDEGSRGLLGLGVRQAVVRLVTMVAAPVEKPAVEVVKKEVVAETERETAVSKPAPQTTEAARTEEGAVTAAAEPDELERDTAVDIVQTLLNNMHVDATITTSISDPDDVTGEKVNIIQIHGEDLGVLIGPRGETLNAMQYIARLIVGHRLRQRTTFVIDIEGYRQRREQALARLAERMAGKVIKRGRPVSLEPMPPHERRIIHMTLRENDAVYTKSVGEGKNRKVRILPS